MIPPAWQLQETQTPYMCFQILVSLLFSMVRPTEQEIIATEKIVCYTRGPQGEKAHTSGEATWGSTRVGQGVEEGWNVGKSL